MEIKTHTESIQVQMAYTLLHVSITDSLVAYKLGRGPLPGQVLPKQLEGQLQFIAKEGIAHKDSLEQFLKGEAAELVPEDVCLVHPDLRDALRAKGFTASFDLFRESEDAVSKKPFTDITEKGFDPANLVRLVFSSHLAFDLAGDPLPIAIHCDYVTARMNDGAYHLKKAEAILKADPRIRFIDEKTRFSSDSDAPGSKKSFIREVPYYNAQKGCSKFLEFWFMPTAEDAKRLWEKQNSYGSRFPSTEDHRAMFDLDILGLRAGGAAKFDDFDKSEMYDDE